MGHKIFVSYKYHDANVLSLRDSTSGKLITPTTVRTYVDALERYFGNTDHINKAESDDEDLSQYSEDTIWEKLRDRIFDSSVTIVMVSAGMRDANKRDENQWIPWEISFSLCTTSRDGRKSPLNALLAVVLPDRNNSYDYFVTKRRCCAYGCSMYHVDSVFAIVRNNMFNEIQKQSVSCLQGECVYNGEHSYIKPVLWEDFIQNPNSYIESAIAIRENADAYDIQKEV